MHRIKIYRFSFEIQRKIDIALKSHRAGISKIGRFTIIPESVDDINKAEDVFCRTSIRQTPEELERIAEQHTGTFRERIYFMSFLARDMQIKPAIDALAKKCGKRISQTTAGQIRKVYYYGGLMALENLDESYQLIRAGLPVPIDEVIVHIVRDKVEALQKVRADLLDLAHSSPSRLKRRILEIVDDIDFLNYSQIIHRLMREDFTRIASTITNDPNR